MPLNETVQHMNLKWSKVLGFVDDDVVEGLISVDLIDQCVQVQQGGQIFFLNGIFLQTSLRILPNARRNPVRDINHPFRPAALPNAKQLPVQAERRKLRPLFGIAFFPLLGLFLPILERSRRRCLLQLHFDPAMNACQHPFLAAGHRIVAVFAFKPDQDFFARQSRPFPRLEIAFGYAAGFECAHSRVDDLLKRHRTLKASRQLRILPCFRTPCPAVKPPRQRLGTIGRDLIQLQYLRRPIAECALLDVSYSQLRQHFRNIIDKHMVWRKNDQPFRFNLLLILIQQKS
ncbi:hypothetical protein D3C74_256420 [compost metagenome]